MSRTEILYTIPSMASEFFKDNPGIYQSVRTSTVVVPYPKRASSSSSSSSFAPPSASVIAVKTLLSTIPVKYHSDCDRKQPRTCLCSASLTHPTYYRFTPNPEYFCEVQFDKFLLHDVFTGGNRNESALNLLMTVLTDGIQSCARSTASLQTVQESRAQQSHFEKMKQFGDRSAVVNNLSTPTLAGKVMDAFRRLATVMADNPSCVPMYGQVNLSEIDRCSFSLFLKRADFLRFLYHFTLDEVGTFARCDVNEIPTAVWSFVAGMTCETRRRLDIAKRFNVAFSGSTTDTIGSYELDAALTVLAPYPDHAHCLVLPGQGGNIETIGLLVGLLRDMKRNKERLLKKDPRELDRVCADTAKEIDHVWQSIFDGRATKRDDGGNSMFPVTSSTWARDAGLGLNSSADLATFIYGYTLMAIASLGNQVDGSRHFSPRLWPGIIHAIATACLIDMPIASNLSHGNCSLFSCTESLLIHRFALCECQPQSSLQEHIHNLHIRQHGICQPLVVDHRRHCATHTSAPLAQSSAIDIHE